MVLEKVIFLAMVLVVGLDMVVKEDLDASMVVV